MSEHMSPQEFSQEYEGRLVELLQDPKVFSVMQDLFLKSQLSDEEKRTFETDFLGVQNPLRNFTDGSEPIEVLISRLHNALLIEKGKVAEANGVVEETKEKNSELRKQKKWLQEELDSTKRLQEAQDLLIEQNTLSDAATNVSLRRSRRIGNESYGSLPPMDVEAETELLASYMHTPSLMDRFSQPYLNRMFYKDANQALHKAMMDAKGKITPTNLKTILSKRGELIRIGGGHYIKEVFDMQGTDDPVVIEGLVENVENKFIGRELIRVASEITREIFSNNGHTKIDTVGERINRLSAGKGHFQTTIDDFVEFARSASLRVLEVLPYRYRTQYKLGDQFDELVQETEDLIARDGRPLISTGYAELDKLTHGVIGGKLHMFGARPKIGKTTLSVNVADNVVEQGSEVAIFSYELTYKKLLQQFIAKRAKVDLEKFIFFDKGENPFTKEELRRIKDTREEIRNLPIYIKTGRPPELGALVAEAQRYKFSHPDIKLMIFDGLQAFEYLVPRGGNKSDYFYSVLTTLKKDIAEELDVDVWLNAQLLKSVEKFRDKKPRSIDDFSDCKGIPEIADGAYLLYRPEHYFPEDDFKSGKFYVNPVELRNSGRKWNEICLGADIKHADIFSLKK